MRITILDFINIRHKQKYDSPSTLQQVTQVTVNTVAVTTRLDQEAGGYVTAEIYPKTILLLAEICPEICLDLS